MLRKSMVIAAMGLSGIAVSVSTPASAHDTALLGALVGAGVGSAIGASVNGHQGAALGGALGAIAGAAIAADGNRHWDSGYYVAPQPAPVYYAPAAPRFYDSPRVIVHERGRPEARWHDVRFDHDHRDSDRHRR